MRERPVIIVIGAGLAGAASAWALSRRFGPAAELLVLEKEVIPGSHASAQNAAMVRSLVDEPVLTRISIEGCQFWNQLPEELAGPGLFRRNASLLLAESEDAWRRLQARAEEARGLGLHPELWTAADCVRLLPMLADCPIRGAVYSPEDGIADPASLIEHSLAAARGRGAQLRLGSEVERLLHDEEGVLGLLLEDGERLEANALVLAAGAWTEELLQRSGLPGRELLPRRRHLYASSPWPGLDPEAPFVWHVDAGAYFRPEGGGVLFSVCDEEVVPPGRPVVDDEVFAEAEQKLERIFPFLEEVPIAHAWAGLRTYADGGGFLLGPDPQLAGLSFAAGLGGHGVTCAGPVGQRVAESLVPKM
ncbi:MAG: hypothetical protein CSA62_08735 [Planctomycetota bacterium]|nr:MAG: hypothetical protein CSA62_08735 [Planctomycetota bacterium]